MSHTRSLGRIVLLASLLLWTNVSLFTQRPHMSTTAGQALARAHLHRHSQAVQSFASSPLDTDGDGFPDLVVPAASLLLPAGVLGLALLLSLVLGKLVGRQLAPAPLPPR